jgi:Ca2+-binding EF-hand superfamily protein
MFEAVDVNNDGSISEDEWVEFWETVKSHGHSDEEIMEEIQNLQDHGSWVQFVDVPYRRQTSN